MISFTVRTRRNEDVHAWDLRVEAWLDPAEEVTSDPRVEAMLAAAWTGEEGVRIGRLDALLVHLWPVGTADGLLEALEMNDGDGNTWDASEGVRATAAALIRWASAGGAEGLFRDSEDPVETLVLSAGLEADPFVDRGALLAMMVQHLSAHGPNRLLFAHEEPPETDLPPDQRGRVRERARAFRSVSERVGLESYARVPDRTAPGPSASLFARLMNVAPDRLLLVGSLLPDGPDYPEWTVWDELEIELIDLAEWARARLGVELTLTADEGTPVG